MSDWGCGAVFQKKVSPQTPPKANPSHIRRKNSADSLAFVNVIYIQLKFSLLFGTTIYAENP